MADKVVELRKTQEEQVPAVAVKPARSRAGLRLVLLVVIPLIALAGGAYFYLMSGRYISTDNAYVGAQKVLITPDISGKIAKVTVTEGQRVNAGDALLEIDAEPFRISVTQAEARLASVRTEFLNLKTNLASVTRRIVLARETVDLKQRDVERKNTLLSNKSGSQMDMDNSLNAVVTAKTQLEMLEQQEQGILNQLLGDKDLPIEKYPPYAQASAALDQAKRDLDHTVLRAPIAGMATQVASIQMGRYVTAGTPVFSLIDDTRPWVDANPKETDITHLRIGQPVAISVDTFPGRTFRGTVAAVSPGTGAQFAILPPQNASGNWVKVVQRVPVRIEFAPAEDVRDLRAGMSVTVDIDTGRQNTVLSSLGLSSKAAEPRK
ncbi:MAG: rane fusion protein multidrug efflux system [Hyphomicrobiales bacterium]|jgi:membrane fusion protein (multidrug efflux system)|nr:rane fusion protein multidrug efflux system [Hyphomicrobiales bacterium]